MGDRGDSTVEVIDVTEYLNTSSSNNKKSKSDVLNKIIMVICAMLNTIGGKVILKHTGQPKLFDTKIPFLIRTLEQTLISIIGSNQGVSNINFKDEKDRLVVVVNKADSLVMNNYNLYLPSRTQVVKVNSWELDKVKKNIIHKKVVSDPLKLGSHHKNFIKGDNSSLRESKKVQLKNLKAEGSKRTKFVDRMIGKGNKFSCYISAFANYIGGHLYFGIKDDGVVQGEKISSEDMSGIIKKVEKAINKMIWPETIGVPKRGEHWEIFFEPLLDKDSKLIPSTFVIVIYIAPCRGGVFTEEPECYEMVEEKAQKMSFTNWKKRMLYPLWRRVDDEIPPIVSRTNWSSPEAREAFIIGGEKLRRLIGNGHWKLFDAECEVLQSKSKSHDVKLLVLSQKVKANYRKGEVVKAFAYLKEYKEILSKAQDCLFFEAMGCYLEAVSKRAHGDLKGLEIILIKALQLAELIEPGLVTAAIYTFAGTVTDLVKSKDETKHSPDILSRRALEHLQHVGDLRFEICRELVEDMKRKVHMTLATFYLGCNINGKLIQDKIDSSRFEEAKGHITAVEEFVREEHPLNKYFKTQRNLVLTIYNYRKSQFQILSHERVRYLKNAFKLVEKAERRARKSGFTEMVQWSLALKGVCTEELVRAKFTNPE